MPAERDRNDGVGQRLLGRREVNRARQREEQSECGRRCRAPVKNDLAQRARSGAITPNVFCRVVVPGGRERRDVRVRINVVAERRGCLGMSGVNVRLGDEALERARQEA